MRYFLVLACLTIAKAGVIKDDNKENEDTCVTVHGVHYKKTVIAKDLDIPYMLVVDNSSNILYFSYSTNAKTDTFKTAMIDLDDNHLTELGILNGFAQTVDQKTRDVYIGSDNGIYKYNHKNNETEFFTGRGLDIWYIYFKDVLYFSEFRKQFLNVQISDTVYRFPDLEDTKVDQFIIDNEDTMFFTNNTGVFKQKKGSKDAVLIQALNAGPRGVTIDGKGDIYYCLKDGIYKIDKDVNNDDFISQHSMRPVGKLDECFGIAFDRDNNIIYSDEKNILILKPDDEKSCHA